MEVIWRSNAELNPVGCEARLISLNGEKTLEAVFVHKLTFIQKIRAIWCIIIGKSISIAEIFI